MRYEDAHRLRRAESFWSRLKRRLSTVPWRTGPTLEDLSRSLSEHDRRDIGLPEPVQRIDWKALQDNGWR